MIYHVDSPMFHTYLKASKSMLDLKGRGGGGGGDNNCASRAPA